MTTPGAVLIVGAGMLQVPLIQEAQRLGLSVIVTDGNPDAPGRAIADTFHHVNTYNIDGHRALAAALAVSSRAPLLGVCTAGADVAPTVAAAAEAANVPGISSEVARRTHDKAEVRRCLSRAGIVGSQPCWLTFHSTIADTAHRLGYPCVVKPATQRASRGVTIVRDFRLLPNACMKALAYGNDYLIEECLVGTEHSAEAIFNNQMGLLWFNIVDRVFDYSSDTGIEVGHVNPSSLSLQQQAQVCELLCIAATALGVDWGPFKVDLMWADTGPKILEVTARLSGGFDCQGTSPLTGRYPMRTLLQLVCDLPIERPRVAADGFAACAAILSQQSGVVQALPELLPLERERIHERIWAIRTGDTIQPAGHNAERAGFVLAHADTYSGAWESAKWVADRLAKDIIVKE